MLCLNYLHGLFNMKNELEQFNKSFSLNEKELANYNKWKNSKEISKLCKKGGVITFKFTFTGIGVAIYAQVENENECISTNITDYNSW